MFVDSHITVGGTLGVLLLRNTLITTFDDFKTTMICFVIGLFLGVLPDIDFLSKYFKSNLYYFEHHRKWTHSIFVHIIIALISSKLLMNFGMIENQDFWTCVLSIFAILFSHIVLDMFTSWGVYLFYPFKNKIATHSISIIDFIFSILMIAQVVLIFFFKTSSWLFAPIILAFLYLIFAFFLRFYIKNIFIKALKNQEIQYYSFEVKPTFMNTILWTINVKTKANDYLIGYYSIFQKTKKITFSKFQIQEHLIDYDDIMLLNTIDRLKNVVSGWYSYTILNGQLYMNDVRYGFKTTDLDEKQFAQSFLITNHNGKYEVFRRKIKFKRYWLKKLLIRFFKA